MNNILLKYHFLNQRNIGVLDSYDYKIVVRSDQCNDIVWFTVTIDNDIINDIKFEAYGCGYVIADASTISEIVKGKILIHGCMMLK